MDFLDRAFDEAFYALVKTLRDGGSQKYMLARANVESNLRGLINQRTNNDEQAKKLFLQKMTLLLSVQDFAFRKLVPLFEKKKKLKDVIAELNKENKPVSPEVTGKIEHLFDIYHFAIKGKPLPPP